MLCAGRSKSARKNALRVDSQERQPEPFRGVVVVTQSVIDRPAGDGTKEDRPMEQLYLPDSFSSM